MAHSFWKRYLTVFDRVRVVARGTSLAQIPEGWLRVNSSEILFHVIPDFQGPWQYIRRYPVVQAAIRAALPRDGAVILRAGIIANFLERLLHQESYPYALEVIGDPYDVFSPGSVDHVLRPLFRWYFTRRLRQQCVRAVGVAYVTKRVLQQRYPARSMSIGVSDVDLIDDALAARCVATSYSSVEFADDFVVDQPRKPRRTGIPRLVTVGPLERMYKGTDVLIDAVGRCVRSGVEVTLQVVGEGKCKPRLMAQADRLGLGSRITFLGQVTAGEPVRKILDASDLFVLPSRTEGLPRALLEAMARGLPCVASQVGGIPELLPEEDLVKPGDAVALAAKINSVLRSESRLMQMSFRNIHVASEYRAEVLNARRVSFYRAVRSLTVASLPGKELGGQSTDEPWRSSGPVQVEHDT